MSSNHRLLLTVKRFFAFWREKCAPTISCQGEGFESDRGRTEAVAAFSFTLVNSSVLSVSSWDTPQSRARSSSRASMPYCDPQKTTPGFISIVRLYSKPTNTDPSLQHHQWAFLFAFEQYHHYCNVK